MPILQPLDLPIVVGAGEDPRQSLAACVERQVHHQTPVYVLTQETTPRNERSLAAARCIVGARSTREATQRAIACSGASPVRVSWREREGEMR